MNKENKEKIRDILFEIQELRKKLNVVEAKV